MSIRVMSAVWERMDVDGTLLLLMLALADHANDAGVCWPSVVTLSHKIRRSRARTFELLRKAEGMGLLTHVRGLGGRANQYQLTIGEGPALRTVQPSGRSGDSDAAPSEDSDLRVQPTGPQSSGNHQKNRHSSARTSRAGETNYDSVFDRGSA